MMYPGPNHPEGPGNMPGGGGGGPPMYPPPSHRGHHPHSHPHPHPQSQHYYGGYGGPRPPMPQSMPVPPANKMEHAIKAEAAAASKKKNTPSRMAARHDDEAEGVELSEHDCLVQPEDKPLLTEYFYFLNQQLKPCKFKESDRKSRGGKRKSIKVGFGGIACRHCWGKHGARKFFWADVDRLANSFSEIPAHVMKCHSCPDFTKGKLADLKLCHPLQMSNLPRGWQKIFFRRMWRRIHDHETQQEPAAAAQDTASPTNANNPASEEGAEWPDNMLGFGSGSRPGPNNAAASKSLLAMPEDKQWLSDLDCQIRTWIEVFKVTDSEMGRIERATGEQLRLDQVGLRCVFCTDRADDMAIQFPPAIDRIYESVRELQRLHFHKCPNMPENLKKKVAFDKSASSLSSILRRYYVISAKAHGMRMYDHLESGICASNSVPPSPNSGPPQQNQRRHHGQQQQQQHRMGGPPSEHHPHDRITDDQVFQGAGDDSTRKRMKLEQPGVGGPGNDRSPQDHKHTSPLAATPSPAKGPIRSEEV